MQRRAAEVSQTAARQSHLPSHPARTHESSVDLARVWHATCKVLVGSGAGSGFFVDGGSDGTVVVTNAHVVDGHPDAQIAWLDIPLPFGPALQAGTDIVTCDAKVLAVDYAHDLAVLGGLPPVFNRPSLELSAPPIPGQDVFVCGFPLHAETPRIARALVSGWETMSAPAGNRIATVVLDGSVNPGNSGGPACNPDGRVVGVVCSRRSPFLLSPQALAKLGKAARKIVDFLGQTLIAHTGIGYALDPSDVRRLLNTRRSFAERGPLYEKFPPADVGVPRSEFLALQASYAGAPAQPFDTSPIGVFSIDRTGQYYSGWYQSPDRVPIATTDFWRRNAGTLTQGWDGGSFMLRGYDVLLYRKQYRGYIVSARLRLVEDV